MEAARYEATTEELAAIDRGLDDVRRGRLAADEVLAEARAKFRGEGSFAGQAGARSGLKLRPAPLS